MYLVELDFCSIRDSQNMAAIDLESHKDSWSLEAIKKDLSGQGDHAFYLGAKKKRTLVGFVAFQISDSCLWILRLSVDTSFRRMGVASQLMWGASSVGDSLGAHKVSLSVREGNERAQKFYRHLGFKKTKEISDYYSDGEGAWRMERLLPME